MPNLINGFIIGILIAAPVGPIGLLCIQRTLAGGWLLGLATGLGAATADAFYGTVAAFGLTMISNFLINQQLLLRLLGGLFLCFLGLKIMLGSNPKGYSRMNNPKGLANAYLTTLFLTITNPMTVMAFLAAFARLEITGIHNDYLPAMFLVFGVFGGSLVWWFILSGSVTLFKDRVSPNLHWMNLLSGAIIAIFGLSALYSLKNISG